MEFATNDTLHKFEQDATVGQILSAYFNVNGAVGLVNKLSLDNGIINCWAKRTNLNKYELIAILYQAYNTEATFKVEHEIGPADCPECSLCFIPNKQFNYNKPILFVFDWEFTDN